MTKPVGISLGPKGPGTSGGDECRQHGHQGRGVGRGRTHLHQVQETVGRLLREVGEKSREAIMVPSPDMAKGARRPH